jgi:hypothetical protein
MVKPDDQYIPWYVDSFMVKPDDQYIPWYVDSFMVKPDDQNKTCTDRVSWTAEYASRIEQQVSSSTCAINIAVLTRPAVGTAI